MKRLALTFLWTLTFLTPAYAYTEFQVYAKEVSGRAINCAICHMHSDGPEGLKHGQIGSLDAEGMKALGMARQAFKSGSNAENPILNKFGNSILHQLGKEQILMLRQHPELLAKHLSETSDLDGDGIVDREEFEDGTHPLNSLDGQPWKLFKNNFKKNAFHIFMLALATGFGLFGLSNALLWLSSKMRRGIDIMQEQATSTSHKTLFLNTLAFTVCFAAWMLNGVLVTFLAANQVFDWGPIEIGWLMGIPVLTGAIFRLPAGMLTDKFGGKPIYGALLFICAIPMYLLGSATNFFEFALYSFGFGLAGVSFSIGIAYTSVWYPKEKQGTALGIFGAGNAGAALTTLFAPTILNNLTNNGANIEGWRTLPKLYAAMFVIMGIIFFIFSTNKKPESSSKTWLQMLRPLKDVRVWRFGLYYFLVFGCFVAFAQWLVPYFVNVYYLPLVTAGLFASCFSLPSGIIRALGGWMSDLWGARKVMYWVLGTSVLISFLLIIPKMDIYSPGRGVMAKRSGVVESVTGDYVQVDTKKYSIIKKTGKLDNIEDEVLIFPTKEVWQEPVVKVGQSVKRKELLAKGVTKIHFQANVWIFAVLVILLGSIWGIGKAAVYKHIPDYFPEEVGVVGGMVGVLGGLGGFFCPIIFGYLLTGTGLWTSCWMFMFFVSLVCLIWMHRVIVGMMKVKHPESSRLMEN